MAVQNVYFKGFRRTGLVTLPQSKFTFHLFQTPNSIYTIKCNPVWGMQVAHRGLIKNVTIPWQENQIKNMAASVNQVLGRGNSSESHEGCACFCVCVLGGGGAGAHTHVH